ncbi:MAG: multidrug effflux MFS transporter [Cyclobacteriaceae bacterium]|nr:multidrug effflux MFS transporter [Cyclobacteriaceae bacterium]
MPKRPRKFFLVLMLGLLSSISPFAIDMYLPAFSQIAQDFATTPARISLSVVSYFVGLAVGQVIYGPLLDRYGRRRPLITGLSIFIVASIACAMTHSQEELIALRFVQAMGGCVAWVSSMAMVRDFFTLKESANVFSLLVLILGVSPLLAPTVGGFVTEALGWRAIFFLLGGIVAVILAIMVLALPEGHEPDPHVSLKPGPILKTYASVVRTPQFYTYAFSGAFSFAALFIYVSGSPIVFMQFFGATPRTYGFIFALLSLAFIGSSQLNILLTRRFANASIYTVAISLQLIVSMLFLAGAWNNWFDMNGAIGMFFLMLACVGLMNPNGSALAMAPFKEHAGSAASMFGFAQIGLGALVSSSIGVLNAHQLLPIVVILSVSAVLAWSTLMVGKGRIKSLVTGEESSPTPH